SIVFFFVQAEDGIRDFHVTGVQTCALPISGAVDGDRIQRVFEGRAKATGQSIDEIKNIAMANQSIKRLVDPRDIAALAVFLASRSEERRVGKEGGLVVGQ